MTPRRASVADGYHNKRVYDTCKPLRNGHVGTILRDLLDVETEICIDIANSVFKPTFNFTMPKRQLVPNRQTVQMSQ